MRKLKTRGVSKSRRFSNVDDRSSTSGFSDNQGSVRVRNLSLRALIRLAYGVMDAQLEAPGWTTTSVWDIVAKLPGGYEARQLPDLATASPKRAGRRGISPGVRD
jgi:uncharacterized protein (TIGR03435 family)